MNVENIPLFSLISLYIQVKYNKLKCNNFSPIIEEIFDIIYGNESM